MSKYYVEKVKNYIGGSWQSSSTDHVTVTNPATGDALGSVPKGSAADVDAAVAGRQGRLPGLARHAGRRPRALPVRPPQHHGASTTTSSSRALHAGARQDARGVQGGRRARHRERRDRRRACPSMMMGDALEQIATGIDCVSVRQPMGVFATIAPYNFPSMVPFWFLPYAIATGNTVVVKPSEQVPFSQHRLFELIDEKLKLPPGVVNMVHGGARRGERHPRPQGHRRRLVRRLDAGRRARLRALRRDGKRVAGARRREELHGRHGRLRLGQDHPEHHRQRVRRARASAASRRASSSASARPTASSRRSSSRGAQADQGRLRDGAGRHDGPGHQRDAQGARRLATSSKRRQGGGRAAPRRAQLQGRRLPEGALPRPDDLQRRSRRRWRSRTRRSSARSSACIEAKTLDEAIAMANAHPMANAASIYTSNGAVGAQVRPRDRRLDGRREHRRRGPDGVLHVRREQAVVLRRPQGARPDSVRFYTQNKTTIQRWW